MAASGWRSGGPGLNYDWGFTGGEAIVGGGGGGGGGSPDFGNWQELQLERDLAGQREAGEMARASLAAEASKYPAMLQHQRYQQMLPFAMQQWNRAQGRVGPAPEISVGPIWSDAQVQQQINAGRARNDEASASQKRDTEQNLAGKGYGSRSPLLAALQGQQDMSNMSRNSDLERETRWGTAQGNKEQILKTQQARSQQYLGVEDIKQRRDAAKMQGLSALMAALI